MEKNGGGGAAAAAAPTGCYKCGRLGHWSRDCPSNPNSANPPVPNSNLSSGSNSNASSHRPKSSAPTEKPKKAPRTRPKLTPELLLSDAGIGHILRHFPRAIKCRGRGHEVDDLGHLLGLYAEWHSRLIPYYSFDQFIRKVEQVGSTKRVKVCLRDLRDRVANGVDPAKLHESEVAKDSFNEQDAQGDLDMPSLFEENSLQNSDTNLQDDIPHVTWENATEETPQPVHIGDVTTDISGGKQALNQTPQNDSGKSNKSQISEEQRTRIEANKLKALERAAARGRSSRPA